MKRKDILKLPINYDRNFSGVFKWGIEQYNMSQESFYNNSLRCEHSIYLINVCGYLGLAPETLTTFNKLTQQFISADVIGEGCGSYKGGSGVSSSKRVEYRASGI